MPATTRSRCESGSHEPIGRGRASAGHRLDVGWGAARVGRPAGGGALAGVVSLIARVARPSIRSSSDGACCSGSALAEPRLDKLTRNGVAMSCLFLVPIMGTLDPIMGTHRVSDRAARLLFG